MKKRFRLYAICKLIKVDGNWVIDMIYRDTMTQSLKLSQSIFNSKNMRYKPNYPTSEPLYTSFDIIANNLERSNSSFTYRVMDVTNVK